MGTDALPALCAVSNSSDPELRTRVESLLARIQSHAMTRASLVRLDFGDRACDEILKDSAARHGPTGWPGTRKPRSRFGGHTSISAIPLRSPSGWRWTGFAGPPGSITYRVRRRPGFGYRPVSFVPGSWYGVLSPFRRRALAIRAHWDQPLPHDRPDPDGELFKPAPGGRRHRFTAKPWRRFQCRGALLVEPRMLISRSGQALIAEAVDDRGQSLLPDDKPHLQRLPAGASPPWPAFSSG